VNADRARGPAGQQIKVMFGDETQTLVVDVGEGTEPDDVAAALVDCLEAGDFDDAEVRLQTGLDGLDGSVRRSP
jgi:hypothetical protein